MDRVCHFEIPYDQKDRMETFYAQVFGWHFQDAPGEMPYAFATTAEVDESYEIREPGGINGGTYPRGDAGSSRHPVLVIEVECCQQRIDDVVAAGGETILGPHPLGELGIYAQVRDTEGNIIGLWQPRNAS